MQLNRNDMAVIEQALREAINQGADYYKVSTYQAVLGKLQGNRSPDLAGLDSGSQGNDGFRYDYDDASDLRG